MPSRATDELTELVATLSSASADLNEFLSKRGLPKHSTEDPMPSIDPIHENLPYFQAKSSIIDAAERIVTTTYAAVAEAVGKPEVTPALVERILQEAKE
ncbi:hypothetical protein CH063_11026 [Colletotrichum higginsianum]|uniref:Uncharacterized protein n=1 Tax=Colletotrichum higginsianum (strain IMI 349063) TaxID=759273 RepID=H1VJQ3_COLHI|nr:hypothetical protein CH063_11026 [Colletotrichum higginsianum]